MKTNKQRVILIVFALLALSLGSTAVFVGYRLSQPAEVTPEPGQAATCDCNCSVGDRQESWDGGCKCWSALEPGKTYNERSCDEPIPGPVDQGGLPGAGEACDGECSGALVCDGGTCKPCSDFSTDESKCWTHNKCEYKDGTCTERGGSPDDTTTCNGRGITSDATMCTVGCGGSIPQTDPHNCPSTGGIACSVDGQIGCAYLDTNNPDCGTCQGTIDPSEGVWDGLCYNGAAGTKGKVYVYTGDETDATCPISNFDRIVELNPGECYSLATDCEQADPDGGAGQCVDSGCITQDETAECFEDCSSKICKTGLTCETVAGNDVCIDANTSDGDDCFNLSCTSLTASPTVAKVGDSVSLKTIWNTSGMPSAAGFATRWAKIHRVAENSLIKVCTNLGADNTCTGSWTITGFNETSNNNVFFTNLGFTAYDQDLVCTNDNEIVLDSSRTTVLGTCTNNCTAYVTQKSDEPEAVYPSCIGLTYTKDDADDTVFPVDVKFIGTGKNGDSDHLLSDYKVVVGGETLENNISGNAEAQVSFSRDFTAEEEVTAVLTFLDGTTGYTADTCKTTIIADQLVTDWSIDKESSVNETCITANSQVTYIITATNKGNDTAYLKSLVDVLDSKLSASNISSIATSATDATGQVSGNTIVWKETGKEFTDANYVGIEFKAGESKTFTYEATLPTSGTYKNVATANPFECPSDSVAGGKTGCPPSDEEDVTVCQEGELPRTGMLDNTLKIIFLGIITLAISYYMYVNRIGNEILVGTITRTDSRVNKFKRSLNQKGFKILSSKKIKERFERRLSEDK